MKNIHIKILIVLMAIGMVSCKKSLEKLLTNPNSPVPASADVDLYVNEIELSFNSFFQQNSDYAAQLSRLQNWGGPLYQNAYTPPSFDGIWTTAYSSIINNADAMLPLAEAQKKYVQAGISEVLKAYTLGTLVDMFNNVPYSEAELGLGNINPKTDAAATIYASVQTLLDAAIVDFGKSGGVAASGDLFYGGNAANWVTLANTLKLKFYMQTRLVDASAAAKISALMTTNDLILSAGQDFQFQYGINNNQPDSRHPHYAADYVASGGEGEYLSNYFIWTVANRKYGADSILNDPTRTKGVLVTHGDPRLRYYFYRQVNNLNNFAANTSPCIVEATPAWYTNVDVDYPFCVVGSKGYYGRDHGDNSAAPPDASYRTAWGVYPAGGLFDADQPTTDPTASDGSAITTLTEGAKGAGISPIWQSSFTYFLEAEAASVLNLTQNGTPDELLAKGVDASISKVVAFPVTVSYIIPSGYAPTAAEIANYETLVAANYKAASGAQAKLNVIMIEYYIALWGNGIEAYNNLRRTGMPLDLQPAATTPNPGVFMRSFLYPSVYENRNINAAPQKNPGKVADKVFWDNNPDNNFIN